MVANKAVNPSGGSGVFSITVLSWIFIATGCISLARGLLPLLRASASKHIAELNAQELVDVGIVSASGLLAILGGVFMLRGFNWARWLCVAWMGFHLIVSILHSLFELAVHSVLFAVVLYFLFHPPASAYFRARKRDNPT